MNQKIIFYLLSLLAVFFFFYFYSQFNNSPIKSEIITINTGITIEKYGSDILDLQMQLDVLDNQLVSSLDELQRTTQKFNLSLSKVQVLEDELVRVSAVYKLNEIELNEANNNLSESAGNLKTLKDRLLDTKLDLELTKFELELAEEFLQSQ